MNTRKTVLILALLTALLLSCACAEETTNSDVMYQIATLSSLQMGGFDGVVPVSELTDHGNIGIGTFDAVNGEMIFLEGTVYQALADGTIQIADPETHTPFCTVTYFEPDVIVTLTDVQNLADFTEKMDGLVRENGANNLYVVRIDGTFDHLLVRSVLPQEKPYKMLSEAMATSQVEHDLENVEGTIVGIYFPGYFSQLNLDGWHFHFITSDRLRGGHVLSLSFSQAEATLDVTTGFEVFLPQTDAFQQLDLLDEHVSDVKQIETAE